MKRIQHRKREKFLLKHFQKLLGIHSIVRIRKHDSAFHRRQVWYWGLNLWAHRAGHSALNHIPSLKKQSTIALIHFPVRIVGRPGWPCCPAAGVTELLPTPAVCLQYPIKSPLTDRDRLWYRGACLDVTQCFLVFKPWQCNHDNHHLLPQFLRETCVLNF